MEIFLLFLRTEVYRPGQVRPGPYSVQNTSVVLQLISSHIILTPLLPLLVLYLAQ